MKKKFSKLSKRAQTRAENEYHRMKPEEFDELMSQPTHHVPTAVRYHTAS
jgi:hypothetical protein